MGIIIGICLLMIPILYAYYRLDPAGEEMGRWFPKCPLKVLTGWQCPSCGIQRSLHSLLHGDILASLRHNWFILFSLCYLAGMWIGKQLRDRHPAIYKFFWGERGGWMYVAVYCLWFLIRNLLGI